MVGTDIAVPGPDDSVHNALAIWAEGARAVTKLAEHVASSALVPQAYRGKPVDVLACWLTGQELGIQPMAALRSIDVIQGTPSLRAHAMRALVQSQGHEIEIVESDDTHCVMRGRRHLMAAWQTVTWDLDRAKLLGLLGKDQWTKQPRTMLIARATGELCRLIAADVLYAVPYATEEVQDSEPLEPVRATATVTAAALVETAAQPSTTVASPPVEKPATAVVEGPADPEMITDPQSRKLQTLFGKAGIDDRESRLAWASDVVGRELGSSKELTRDEARRVIDAVEAFIEQERGPAAAGETS